ncbi:MAG: AAA family ATPase [Herminiimonas sp.]|nr:AAA family ATPase [Herminiimonas sp.]
MILIQSLMQALAAAGAHGMVGNPNVRCFETHLSWVLVAGDFAYKLKKAVRLPFVDFSTLAARRFYCDAELRLNRRLAPDLYLAVEPITGSATHPRIGGSGEAIEYVLEMRAFDQSGLWSERIANRSLSPAEIDSLANQLARFHDATDRSAPASAWGSVATVQQTADDNLEQLQLLLDEDGEGGILSQLWTWQRDQHAVLAGVFDRRKQDGFVRECHGDLHAGNVVTIGDRVAAFDCIEFSEAFRWIDVMSDIAFIDMDLRCRGVPAMAARLLDRYLAQTGDYAGLPVYRYYRAQRALVRAKIGFIRNAQHRATAEGAVSGLPEVEEAAHYLAYAVHAVKPPTVAIMITHGFSGSGKSTFSQSLLELTGAIRLRSDVERKRLHALAATTRHVAQVGAGMYCAVSNEATYLKLQMLARWTIAAGFAVIVDAAFLEKKQRSTFRALAGELGVPFFQFDLRASHDTLRRRITARSASQDEPSDANLAVLAHQLRDHEPLADDEAAGTIVIDAEARLDQDAVAQACKAVLLALEVGGDKPGKTAR